MKPESDNGLFLFFENMTKNKPFISKISSVTVLKTEVEDNNSFCEPISVLDF